MYTSSLGCTGEQQCVLAFGSIYKEDPISDLCVHSLYNFLHYLFLLILLSKSPAMSYTILTQNCRT